MKINYRPEIDGLRALAVLGVVFYHAEFYFFNNNILKGGYLGVDVFFVISGYLITSLILKELKVTGKFSLSNFYERRARRILPVLFLIILSVTPFALIAYLPDTLINFSKSTISSIFFSSNFYFYISGQDYWEISSNLKPLLHTWSLSVEEQFYLVFPLFFIFVNKFFKKHILLFLISFFFLSLILYIFFYEKNPLLTFYTPITRGWELLAGAIIAWLESRIKKKQNFIIDEFLGVVGLVIIFYYFFYADNNANEQIIFSIAVVIGTTLIIWFSNNNTNINKFLSKKYLVKLGLISYSLYLWHFPIFSFTVYVFGKLNNTAMLLLIIISIIVSIITYKYVETPFRNQKIVRQKSFLIILSILLLTILLTAFVVIKKQGITNLITFNEFQLKNLINGGNKIKMNERGEVFGDKNIKPSFIVYGDSHAHMYLNSLDTLAKKKQLSFISFTHPACFSFENLTNYYKKNIRISCFNKYKYLNNFLKKNDLPVLFIYDWVKIISKKNDYKPWKIIDDKSEELESILIDILIKEIEYIKKKGLFQSKWYLIGKVPSSGSGQNKDYLKCINKKRFNNKIECPSKFKISKGSFYNGNNLIKKFAKNNKDFIFLNPYDFLCDAEFCYTTKEQNILYYDHHHLTVFGADLIAPEILNTLNK